MAKILMALMSDFPPDVRVEKELLSLIEFGHQVDLLHYETSLSDKRFDLDGLKLVAIPAPVTKFQKVKNIFFGYDVDFRLHLRRLLKLENYTHIHAHDLDAAYCAILEKSAVPNCKIIADFHENMPEAVVAWRESLPLTFRLILNFLQPKSKLKKREGAVCSKADFVISVVSEMEEFLVKKHNLDITKSIVISNLESRVFNQSIESFRYSDNAQFNVLYVGGFGVHRGLHTAICAMRYIKNKNVHLWLVGKGNKKLSSWYNQLIKDFKLEKCVTFVDWIPFTEVHKYMNGANLCIIPHESNDHTDNTIPHKLFQYMCCGRPILVSDCAPLRRIVNEAHCGLVFKAGNSQDFAKVVDRMANDVKKMKEYSKNGYQYVHNQGNSWEVEALKLRSIYN
jgi:glycosyltransferase involved in cell wall biosynthesis